MIKCLGRVLTFGAWLSVFLIGGPTWAAGEGYDLTQGAVLRLVIFHHDGFGDLHNALALSRQLSAHHPGAKFPIVVEEARAFDTLAKMHVESARDEDALILEDVTVWRGQTPGALDALAAHALQIVFLPAGNERIEMVWGTGAYNLYVEEPGVPNFEIVYADALTRGVVSEWADGSRHLRINPGFGGDAYGVAPPVAPPEGAVPSRAELIDFLESAEIPVDRNMVRARWGAVYYHAGYGIDAEIYLSALAICLKHGALNERVVIFDFGKSRDPRAYLAAIFGSPVKMWRRLWRRRPPLDLVKLGPVPHDLYLHFVNKADLPISVTGTQSLLEAIQRDHPFVYEFIHWKMDLHFGIARVIVDHFDGEERTFLLDWILGEGDAITSAGDVERARAAYATDDFTRGEAAMKRHRFAVVELMYIRERQDVVRRLMVHLRAEFTLGLRMGECVAALTGRGGTTLAN